MNQMQEKGGLLPVFESDKDGWVDPERGYTLSGLERHVWARPDGVRYPRRVIQPNVLFIIVDDLNNRALRPPGHPKKELLGILRNSRVPEDSTNTRGERMMKPVKYTSLGVLLGTFLGIVTPDRRLTLVLGVHQKCANSSIKHRDH